MAVPGFQEFFLPLLQQLGDGEEHYLRDLCEDMARTLELTQEDREELLPSGNQTILRNRVSWAKTYLLKAGFVESTRRAHFRITPQGMQLLRNPPEVFNVRYLRRIPEFLEFHGSHQVLDQPSSDSVEIASEQTPMEILESAYENLRSELAHDLLEHVYNCSPEFFERLVIELLVRMGYGGSLKEAGKRIGRSGDEGIDGIIKEDKLGLGFVYVQAKRWKRENTVSRPEIQKFVGALQGQQATKGVFITTSSFTPSAIEYANRVNLNIVLVSGEDLVEYMIDHDLGVTQVAEYRIKKLDGDYFENE